MFSESAIKSAAASAKLDDVRYCTEHRFTDKDFKRLYDSVEIHLNRDGGKTYNRSNILEFRKRAAEIMRRGGKAADLYAEASEAEHFAIRCLYYDSY